jgi:hypothetical protein
LENTSLVLFKLYYGFVDALAIVKSPQVAKVTVPEVKGNFEPKSLPAMVKTEPIVM